MLAGIHGRRLGRSAHLRKVPGRVPGRGSAPPGSRESARNRGFSAFGGIFCFDTPDRAIEHPVDRASRRGGGSKHGSVFSFKKKESPMAARKTKKKAAAAPAELIISKSRTKAAVKKCNVSSEFYGALDAFVRNAIKAAEARALDNGRKTLRPYDL
jgi:hypothetical protein